MADRTLTINHADGGSETYTLKTEDVLGVRSMQVDGETVTIDHTAPDLVRTIIADGQTITINTTREGVRTLTVDGSEITIDRTEEANLESFLQKFTGASAAYSLQDLALGSGSTTVVRVRRSSDHFEDDFTASEVSNGTLTTWVNEDVVVGLADTLSEFSVSKLSRSNVTVEGEQSYKFTLDNHQNTTHYSNPASINFIAGKQYNLSFKYYIPAGQTVYRLNLNYGGYGTIAMAQGTGEWKQFNLNFTSTQTRQLRIYASDANINIDGDASGEFFALQDITLTQLGDKDGFVPKWYDQSGNGRDGVQSTASKQPMIVSNGSLVTGGLDWSGSNSLAIVGAAITSLNSASSFFVGRSDTTGSTVRSGLTLSSSSSSKRWYAPILLSGNFRFGYASSATAITFGGANTNEHLFTAIAGTSTAKAYYDGSYKGAVTSTSGTSGSDSIGSIGSSSNWDGKIQQLIIYNSDQSANRVAIETHINNQYEIY